MSKRIDTTLLSAAVLRVIHDGLRTAKEIQRSPRVASELAELPVKKDGRSISDMRYVDGALQALSRAGLIEHRRKAVGKVVQRAGWYVTRKGRAAL